MRTRKKRLFELRAGGLWRECRRRGIERQAPSSRSVMEPADSTDMAAGPDAVNPGSRPSHGRFEVREGSMRKPELDPLGVLPASLARWTRVRPLLVQSDRVRHEGGVGFGGSSVVPRRHRNRKGAVPVAEMDNSTRLPTATTTGPGAGPGTGGWITVALVSR